jgi:phage terminase large subunit GpA-like protein
MLAVTEPGVRVITAMVATQLLKTTLLMSTAGFFAHLDPCPMLLVQPKEAAAEAFSKERVEPMIKETPVLRAIVGSSRTRSKDETLLFKAFPGGFLAMVGAGSPDNLARRPVRVIMYDEIDKYVTTKEGDPLALGDERLATFDLNSLSIRVCSPTEKGGSRIEKSYEASDLRRASVVCPLCDHRQFLDFFKQVHWPKIDGDHQTCLAQIHCESCGAAWSEGQRLKSLRTIRWHQTRAFSCCGERHDPAEDYERAWREGDGAGAIERVWDWWTSPRHAVYRARCRTCGVWGVPNEHAGFQASKLFSPSQKDKPSDIAGKWIAAQGDEDALQAFYNTQLAIPYRRNTGREIKADALAARAENWAAEVPDGVAVITAGIDTQDYRLEATAFGWGRLEEAWTLEHEVFVGDPETDPHLWDQLDAWLKKIRYRADGRGFEVAAACIDSGGHHTQRVYDFAKARLGRKVWATKGESATNGKRNPIWPVKRPSSRTKKSFRPVILGVNAAKDVVHARLIKTALSETTGGPGYVHHHADLDAGYYQQLTAERSVTKLASGGQKYRVWEEIPGRANEAFDCAVYAYAALCGLVHMGLKLNKRADAVGAALTPEQAITEARPVSEARPPTSLAALSPTPSPTPRAGAKRGNRLANRLSRTVKPS